MTMKHVLISIAATTLLVGAAGCSSASDSPGGSSSTEEPTSSAPAGESAVIDIEGFEFSGPDSVAPGTTITVNNVDSSAHTVTADGGEFDVQIAGGATATFKAPSEPGTYSYICTFHPSMIGTLVVK